MKKLFGFLCALFLASSASALDRTITFTWDENPPTDNVTQYDLYRSADGTNYSQIDTLPVPAPALELDDTLTGGTGTYNYYVTASNSWGESEPSNVVDINTAVPGTPGNVRIQVIVDVSVGP